MSLLKCHKGMVFVIIRFPVQLTLTCKNSLMKHLSIHHNYCGCVAGLSTSLCVMDGCWPVNKGIAMLTFRSFREAELWKDCVPEIKQRDWLDGVDMIIVPIIHMPPPEKRFIQILDLAVYDLCCFANNYSQEADQVLRCKGACPSVVSACPDSILKVKGLWDPNYVIINFWSSCEEFKCAYDTPEVKELLDKRYHYTRTDCAVFQLHPLLEADPCPL